MAGVVERYLPGAPLRVFRAGVIRPTKVALAGLALLFLGIYLLDVPSGCTGWLMFVGWIPFGTLGLGFGLSGLFSFLQALTSVGLRVTVHAEGLVQHRLGRASFWRWDQIRIVQSNFPYIPRGPGGTKWYHTCDLRLQNNKALTFCLLEGMEELVRWIEEETCRCQFPEALRAFLAGQTINFGRLQLSTRGIHKGTGTQSWEEVTDIYFDQDGWFTVACEGKPWRMWIVVSPAKIANRRLLLTLLAEIRKPAQAG